MKGILVVRKYKNRRLYDTERSTHITRDELLDAIRNGRMVQVQEADSGEDVTVETLFQVVLSESAPVLNAAIPPEFAHFLARAGREEMERFFREYLPVAMQAFQQSLRQVQDQQRRMMESFFPYASGWGGGWPGFPMPAAGPAPAGTPGAGPDVGELRDKLKDLEAQLDKLRKRK